MKKIGMIGIGIMGKPMLRNLMKHGFETHIFARNREKAEDVIREGAVFHETISECVKAVDAVITMVGFPSDVEEVYFGNGGIFENASQGLYMIDMTTSSPALAKRIFEEAKIRKMHALDAPVTGGDVGAKAGTLSILAGGEKEDYEYCLPLFRAMGSNITYEGPAGNGQHAKMANQIMIAGTLSGICEALTYAKAKGLDLTTFLSSVSSGAAGSRQLDLLADKMVAGDFAPGFFIRHFIKDMTLAQKEAGTEQLHLEVLDEVLKHFCKLQEEGKGSLGTQALIQYYEK